jgi:hypothetical protein
MKARVRTLGVEEHHFVVERGTSIRSHVLHFLTVVVGVALGSEFYITDAGGSRSQVNQPSMYWRQILTIYSA